ncbi:17-beta-hydroxysteroid dehydrogenase 13-like [Drosophila sulfurigaster albostrigata]|uniref:17-beta-hydroxysteroid dehydrogenase 13-like n=1 Tax=Drosophila sulfurigaster albostrigata TaxID=89887 RepID=UPI002D21A934|nr:17-beta-hydroxysteroid dehydrogenase 13-like [Drosophila sulfurigaster albostrigata]
MYRHSTLELAKRGCHIAVVDVNIEGAEDTVRQIHEISKVKAKAYKVNVTSFAEITDIKTNVEQDLGSVTILINSAGNLLHSKPLDPAPEDVQRMIDVNLTSYFWVTFLFVQVTGAAHGQGRAIALELAGLGCHVAVVDIDINGAKETVEKNSPDFQSKSKSL